MFPLRFSPVPTETGEFHCPRCRATQSYEVCVVSNLTYVLSILRRKRIGEQLRCLHCRTVFPPSLRDLRGPDAVQDFESRYDRALLGAVAAMLVCDDRQDLVLFGVRERLGPELQRAGAASELDAAVAAARERPLEPLWACDPTRLPELSRREILDLVFEMAQQRGLGLAENKRLGEIIAALGLPIDELARVADRGA